MMNHHDFMRKRARPVILVVAFLLLSIFIYTTFYTAHRSSVDNVIPVPPEDAPSVEAIDAAISLLDKTRPPANTSDFLEKGDRIAKLGDIVTHLRELGIANYESFDALFRNEFPWWTASNRENAYVEGTGDLGMVVCVGSKNVQMAGHLILSLRNVFAYNSTIQIAYAGDDDLSLKDQAALLNLSFKIELLNLLEHFDESVAGLKDGRYAMKPFAAIASRFQKTILVDADVIFLKNPATIFEEHPDVAVVGGLFYHDRAYRSEGNSRKSWVQSILGTKPPSSNLKSSLFWKEDLWQEMESGVVAVDKGHPRMVMSLFFSAWMNTKYIREKETYVKVLGDKETYWLATELSSTPYFFQPDYAGLIGTVDSTAGKASPSTMCSAHILHMDYTGDTPFWFNGGLLLNKAIDNKKFATLTHFVTGGTTMLDQPAWRYDGNEYWCAEGKQTSLLAEKQVDTVLERIFQQAYKVEEALGS